MAIKIKHLQRIEKKFASKDKLRPAMMCVLYNKHFAVATNGHLLIVRRFKDKIHNVNTDKVFRFVNIKGKFNKDDKVNPVEIELAIKNSEHYHLLNENFPNVESLFKDYFDIIDRDGFSDGFIKFNTSYLKDAFSYCFTEGLRYSFTKFQYQTKTNFMIGVNDESFDGGSNIALILAMPMLMGGFSRSYELIKNPDFNSINTDLKEFLSKISNHTSENK